MFRSLQDHLQGVRLEKKKNIQGTCRLYKLLLDSQEGY